MDTQPLASSQQSDQTHVNGVAVVHTHGTIAAHTFKYYWLGLLLVLTLVMIAVGGLTRLTDSGLSIVEWKLIMGMIPPTNHNAWLHAFSLYQRYPEYQLLHPDMTLSEFKFIFTLEYTHRMLGRLIGLVTFLPLVWLWVKRQLTSREKGYFLLLLVLVSLQGILGWFMVKSGLVNVPQISHFRLALHFSFALIFMSATLVLLLLYRTFRRHNHAHSPAATPLIATQTTPKLAISPQNTHPPTDSPLVPSSLVPSSLAPSSLPPSTQTSANPLSALSSISKSPISLIFLSLASITLVVQILYGTFMAGLDAGYISQTYPTMFGTLIPSAHLIGAYTLDGIRSLFQNTTWVHFIHRHLGILTSLLLISFSVQTLRNFKTFRRNYAYKTDSYTPQSYHHPQEASSSQEALPAAKNPAHDSDTHVPYFLDNLPIATLYTLLLISLTQPLIGILTVLWRVPTHLAVIHQLLAVLLFQAVIILFFYRFFNMAHLQAFYQYPQNRPHIPHPSPSQ